MITAKKIVLLDLYEKHVQLYKIIIHSIFTFQQTETKQEDNLKK